MSVVVDENITTIEVNDTTTVTEVALTEITLDLQTVGAQGAAGEGVPTGGTANQILVKSSSTDYDTAWVNNNAGVQVVATDPATGYDGQMIYNTTEMALKIWADGDWQYVGIPAEMILAMDGSKVVGQAGELIMYN